MLVEIVNSSIRAQLWEALPPGRFGNIGTEGFGVPANMLLAGLGAFILAEVFAQGLRMREGSRGNGLRCRRPTPITDRVHLDRLLDRRGMTLTELAERSISRSSTSRY